MQPSRHPDHPPGPFVVIAGIPGAGKTTALRALAERRALDTVTVLDSDETRRKLQASAPRVPYPVLRPVVHTMHWLRIARSALRGQRGLVVHETATRRWSRAALVLLAWCAGRPLRMVWVEATPEAALIGQRERTRVIRARAFRRHVRRVSRVHPARAATGVWDAVLVTDRDGAARAVLAALECAPARHPLTSPPRRGRPNERLRGVSSAQRLVRLARVGAAQPAGSGRAGR